MATTIDSFPIELLQSVFDNFFPADIRIARLVSKRFRNAAWPFFKCLFHSLPVALSARGTNKLMHIAHNPNIAPAVREFCFVLDSLSPQFREDATRHEFLSRQIVIKLATALRLMTNCESVRFGLENMLPLETVVWPWRRIVDQVLASRYDEFNGVTLLWMQTLLSTQHLSGRNMKRIRMNRDRSSALPLSALQPLTLQASPVQELMLAVNPEYTRLKIASFDDEAEANRMIAKDMRSVFHHGFQCSTLDLRIFEPQAANIFEHRSDDSLTILIMTVLVDVAVTIPGLRALFLPLPWALPEESRTLQKLIGRETFSIQTIEQLRLTSVVVHEHDLTDTVTCLKKLRETATYLQQLDIEFL